MCNQYIGFVWAGLCWDRGVNNRTASSFAGTLIAARPSCSSWQHPHLSWGAPASAPTTHYSQLGPRSTSSSLTRLVRLQHRQCCPRCCVGGRSCLSATTTSCHRWCWTREHRLGVWVSACSGSCARHTRTRWSSCSSSTGWQVGTAVTAACGIASMPLLRQH